MFKIMTVYAMTLNRVHHFGYQTHLGDLSVRYTYWSIAVYQHTVHWGMPTETRASHVSRASRTGTYNPYRTNLGGTANLDFNKPSPNKMCLAVEHNSDQDPIIHEIT